MWGKSIYEIHINLNHVKVFKLSSVDPYLIVKACDLMKMFLLTILSELFSRRFNAAQSVLLPKFINKKFKGVDFPTPSSEI